MYEHAYHLDFGAKAGAYVDAFMKNIAWERVGERHRHSVDRGAGRDRPAADTNLPMISPAELRPGARPWRRSRRRRASPGGSRRARTDMLPGAAHMTPGGSTSGPTACRRTARSSCTASTASRSARTRPPRCGTAALRRPRARRWHRRLAGHGGTDRAEVLNLSPPPARSAVMKWVTRERPKIDRIACPWLIARFIDERAGVPLRAQRAGAGRGRGDRRHSLRHSRRRDSATSATCAASTPSCRSTGSTIQHCISWRPSCAAPTRRGWI